MKKKILYFILVMLLIPAMTGCFADDIVEEGANKIQQEDENVLLVKEGHPNAYPDKTYGEAFEDFFGEPTWEYFVGTKEGPDEDGDGNPDYTEEGVEIVEFTGYCEYQEVRVKALLQFTLDKDNNAFEVTYLSLNDVPQNNLMLLGLIEKIFEDESSSESSDESAKQEAINAFVGNWTDKNSERAHLQITDVGNGILHAEINWGNSSDAYSFWSMNGKCEYDNLLEAWTINYDDCKSVDFDYDYDEETEIEEVQYENGEGYLYIDSDDGLLYWEDENFDSSNECWFAKDE